MLKNGMIFSSIFFRKGCLCFLSYSLQFRLITEFYRQKELSLLLCEKLVEEKIKESNQ